MVRVRLEGLPGDPVPFRLGAQREVHVLWEDAVADADVFEHDADDEVGGVVAAIGFHQVVFGSIPVDREQL